MLQAHLPADGSLGALPVERLDYDKLADLTEGTA